jgi:hypothetical protein
MLAVRINLQNPVVLYWDRIAAMTVEKWFYIYMNNTNSVNNTHSRWNLEDNINAS